MLGSWPRTWHREKLIIRSDRTVFGFNTWTKRKDQIRCIQPAGDEEIRPAINEREIWSPEEAAAARPRPSPRVLRCAPGRK